MPAAVRLDPADRRAAQARRRRPGRRRRAAARHRRGADGRLDGRRGAAPHADHRAGHVLVALASGVLGQGRDVRAHAAGKSVALDCDGDALLVKVDQVGPACHTGDRTCFDAGALPLTDAAGGARDRPRRSRASSRATHRLVPLTRTLFADAETPVGVYRKLAAGRPGTFLLESAEPGRSFSRWSFVGVDAVATLSAPTGEAVWSGAGAGRACRPTGDPLEVLGAAWRAHERPAAAGAAAAHRRLRRLPRLRRGAPDRDAAGEGRRTTWACPS